jgi:hypothetical protein
MARRQRANLSEGRSWWRDVIQGKIFAQGFFVRGQLKPWILQNSFQLRPENKFFCILIIKERLHAQTISGREKPLFLFIPDRERKHAIKSVETALSPGFKTVDNNFAVRLRTKSVTAIQKFIAQAFIVINLAVVDQPKTSVFVTHRLRALGRQINDTQPPKAQADRPVYI